MLDSSLRIDIIETFAALQSSLHELADAVCNQDNSLPSCFKNPDLLYCASADSRQQLANFLQQLEFVDTQDPKEILLGPGLVACSNTTVEIIKKVNLAKDEFKQAVLALKAAKVKITDIVLTGQLNEILDRDQNKSRSRDISTALNRAGLARLHLKACYRTIPLLNRRPENVSWTWANTRAIKKVDVNTARSMLQKKKQDSGIEQQLRKLDTLNPNDNLAIIQELAPHLRANILTNDDNGDYKRFMIKGSMPIFYVHESNKTLPKFNFPDDSKKIKTNDSVRKKRNDIKIEDAPFLPALHAHRYLEV